MKLLLENFKHFLEEAAIEDISNLGVYDDNNFVILYEANPVRAFIRRAVYEDPDKYDISKYIVGAVRLGWRDGNYTVEEIFANKGYGPVLYRLALERAGRHGLSPSKIKGEVSDAAQNVWKEFHSGKGMKNASFTPYEKPIHDIVYLDGVYHTKGPKVNREEAENVHNKIFSKARDPYDELITHLVEEAAFLLRDKVSI